MLTTFVQVKVVDTVGEDKVDTAEEEDKVDTVGEDTVEARVSFLSSLNIDPS